MCIHCENLKSAPEKLEGEALFKMLNTSAKAYLDVDAPPVLRLLACMNIQTLLPKHDDLLRQYVELYKHYEGTKQTPEYHSGNVEESPEFQKVKAENDGLRDIVRALSGTITVLCKETGIGSVPDLRELSPVEAIKFLNNIAEEVEKTIEGINFWSRELTNRHDLNKV